MPSSWSSSLRFELQFTGENINIWGDKLNAVLSHADFAIAGMTTKALVADYTLTTANATDDEARSAILKFTGAGPFTVTIPPISKTYDVWNACTSSLAMSTGSGTAATVQAGELVRLICDGANVKRLVPTDFAGARLTSIGDPLNPGDAVNRSYADALAFIANSGVLPGQSGAGGWALFSNGSNALWRPIVYADLSDAAARDVAALGRAVALAVAL